MLMFNNPLEGFTELTQRHYTHGYGLLQGKDTNRNQPQGEMHSAESESIPNLKLLLSSGSITLPDSWQCATSTANQQCSPES